MLYASSIKVINAMLVNIYCDDMLVSLKGMVEACVLRTRMTRMMRRLMRFITTSMRGWTRNGETGVRNDSKKNLNVTDRNDRKYNSSSRT